MTSYEIYLLAGGLAGALAIIVLASVVLDQGPVRLFFVLGVISGACFTMADRSSETGIDLRDIPPAISRVIEMVTA